MLSLHTTIIDVDGAAVQKAVKTITENTKDTGGLALEVIDAFSMPPLKFSTAQKMFLSEPANATTAPLHASAESKATMFGLRLAMAEGRVRRSVQFKPPVRFYKAFSPRLIHLPL